MVVVALAPGTINMTTTTTATTAGTMTTTMDFNASLCGHGCALVTWAATAAAAESMPRWQQQLGTRDSNGDGDGAAAAEQRQWWQQWRSAMEKHSLGSALADLGSALADSGCALVTWAAPS